MELRKTMSETRQQTLDGDVKVGGKKISAVLDDRDPEDLEILGWISIFTIGNDFVVDREWLEERAKELGIPKSILPNKTGKKRAYGRAANRLCSKPRSWDADEPDVKVSVHKEAHNEYHLEVTDRRDDDVTTSKIGAFHYDTDLDPSGMRAKVGHPNHDRKANVDVTKGSEWYELFSDYLTAFGEEMRLMENSNLGEDIRTMLRGYFMRKSNSMKHRDGGAVYFAPVTTEEVVQALKTLINDIDREWKDSGFRCELNTIEVINTEEKRNMVRRRAEDRVESKVTQAMEEAFDALDEDKVVDDIVATVEERLGDVGDFAAEYNVLLDTEIAVEERLEEWKDDVTEDQRKIVEKVMEE